MKVKTAIARFIRTLSHRAAAFRRRARRIWLPALRRAAVRSAGCLKRGSIKTFFFLKNNIIVVFVFTALLGGIIGNAGTDWAKNLPLVKYLFPPAPANPESPIASSADYQKLLAAETKLRQRHQKLQEKVRRYPDDDDFKQELAEVQQEWHTAKNHLEQFKHDALKLAETLRRTAPDTWRLREARAHFQQGRLDKARAILNGDTLLSEQKRLLADKRDLSAQTAENKKRLSHNAQEWLLKAQLTALDYSLKEKRIPATRAAFEAALAAESSADNLFAYAYFLDENRQYREAETFYRQALAQPQHGDDAQTARAAVLNNLAVLIQQNPSRHREAEALLRETLAIFRRLSERQPALFTDKFILMLNNLASLIDDNPARQDEAETLYREALSAARAAKLSPQLAQTLNNLAVMFTERPSRRREAGALYREALAVYRELARQQPQRFSEKVADTLNNLAVLAMQQPARPDEAEALFREALSLFRNLAVQRPEIFEPKVAQTLNNLAALADDRPQRAAEAEALYREALHISRRLAENDPEVFAGSLAHIADNLAAVVAQDPARRHEAEALFGEALRHRRQLAQARPQVFRYQVAETLFHFGTAYRDWQQPEQAKPLLREAAELIAPYAAEQPERFGVLQKDIKTLLNQIC